MRVALSSTMADEHVASEYSGVSKPLSVVTSQDRVNDIGWWTSGRRDENIRTVRHRAAFDAYLDVGRRAMPALPVDCFPATFEFIDGVRKRPDKGFIKAALAAGFIAGASRAGELVFELTPAGRDWLRSAA